MQLLNIIAPAEGLTYLFSYSFQNASVQDKKALSGRGQVREDPIPGSFKPAVFTVTGEGSWHALLTPSWQGQACLMAVSETDFTERRRGGELVRVLRPSSQSADPGLAACSGNAESQAPPRPIELESAFQLVSRAESVS